MGIYDTIFGDLDMFYAVCLNPALDMNVSLNAPLTEGVNRSAGEYFNYGGKGINCARVLSELFCEVTVLGYAGGFTGAELVRGVRAMGIGCEMIEPKSGITRINVKLSGGGVEINGKGPHIDGDEIRALKDQLKRARQGDVVILSGSVPAGVSEDIYLWLGNQAREQGAKVAIDADGIVFKHSFGCKPYLVKPNAAELGALFDVSIDTVDTAKKYGVKLLEQGARNVIVSMGGDGALLLCGEGEYFQAAPEGKCVNTVGAGDSLLSAFLAAEAHGADKKEALRLGVAAGSATAFCRDIATRAEIMNIFEKI